MKVSVVIPNYNGKQLLEKNLPRVVEAIEKGVEIIVVDDASTDGSVMFLKQQFPSVRVIQHETNLRFGAACNTGVRSATGDVVMLLNSDVIPQNGFLKPLLEHFDDPLVFSVGCREIEINQGIEVLSGRTEGRFERGLLIHWKPKDQESVDTLWNFGGSMAVDRKKYLQLGGFDVLFSPAYWEDIDLSFRAAKKGWKVLFEKDSVVYHNHETTNASVFGKRNMEIIAYRNQILFSWKHMIGDNLIQHLKWLPYHLVLTSLRSKGSFTIALLMAIWRWFEYRKMNIRS